MRITFVAPWALVAICSVAGCQDGKYRAEVCVKDGAVESATAAVARPQSTKSTTASKPQIDALTHRVLLLETEIKQIRAAALKDKDAMLKIAEIQLGQIARLVAGQAKSDTVAKELSTRIQAAFAQIDEIRTTQYSQQSAIEELTVEQRNAKKLIDELKNDSRTPVEQEKKKRAEWRQCPTDKDWTLVRFDASDVEMPNMARPCPRCEKPALAIEAVK